MDYEHQFVRPNAALFSQHAYWNDASGYRPYLQTPLPDFNGNYSFSQPGPPTAGAPQSASHSPRGQARSLSTSGWVGSVETTGRPPGSNSPPAARPGSKSKPGIMHTSLLPPLPLSHAPPHTPAPRKTLTDRDRRDMCEYAGANPGKKQTEIGELFGVERSTVSKVLRQKDKFMKSDEELKSPQRRPKGKHPDLERAMVNWARKTEKNGWRLTDREIQAQAQKFVAAIRGPPDPNFNIDDQASLERFKAKYKIGQPPGSKSEGSASTSRQSESSAKHIGLWTDAGDSHQQDTSVSVRPSEEVEAYTSPMQVSSELGPRSVSVSMARTPSSDMPMLNQASTISNSPAQMPHTAGPTMSFYDPPYAIFDPRTSTMDQYLGRERSQTYPYSTYHGPSYTALPVSQPANFTYPAPHVAGNFQWNPMGPPPPPVPPPLTAVYHNSPRFMNTKLSISNDFTPRLTSPQQQRDQMEFGISAQSSSHNSPLDSTPANEIMTTRLDIPTADQAQQALETLQRYCSNQPHDLNVREVKILSQMDKVRLRPPRDFHGKRNRLARRAES